MTTPDAWLGLVGLGLAPAGITLGGLETARRAQHVFLEAYTALTPEPLEALQERTGSPITRLTREEVEHGQRLLDAARDGGACLLVAGDPLSATTHTSLRLQAHEENIPVRVRFAASILTAAAGTLGLSHYKFGRTTTLVTPDGDYFPDSPYHVLAQNLDDDLHTLVLLDIHEDGSTMTAREAATLLLELEQRNQDDVITPHTRACIVARAGRDDANAWQGPLDAIQDLDAGEPMHSIVIPGETSVVEDEALDAFATPVP